MFPDLGKPDPNQSTILYKPLPRELFISCLLCAKLLFVDFVHSSVAIVSYSLQY